MMEILKVIPNYLLPALGALVFLALWGMTVLGVYNSAVRRGLIGMERYFWPALALILPLVGALLYGMGRLAGRVIATEPRPDSIIRKDATDTRLPGEGASSPSFSTLPSVPLAVPLPQPEAAPAVPAGAAVLLTVAEGLRPGRVFSISSFPGTIGRAAGAGVALAEDRRVSRQHAELYAQDGKILIRDLGSLHGTLVNGKPAAGQVLREGDRITVGDTVLVFHHS